MNVSLSKRLQKKAIKKATEEFIAGNVSEVGHKITHNVNISFGALKGLIKQATKDMGAYEELNYLHDLYKKSVQNDGLALPEFIEKRQVVRPAVASATASRVTRNTVSSASASATKVASSRVATPNVAESNQSEL